MKKIINSKGKFNPFVLFLMYFIPVVVSLICLGVGRMNLNFFDILDLFIKLTQQKEIDPVIYSIIINIRLPRLIVATMVGTGMTLAGVGFQSLFSNALATPDILGVTSATCLGAIIAILNSMNIFWTQIIALIFGFLSIGLTLFIGKTRENSIINLILSGIIMSSIFNALSSLLKYVADPTDKLPEITYWLMGSFGRASYDNILIGAPLILIGIIMIYLMRWRLNILSLSEEEAKATGINLFKTQLYFIVSCTMITASSISICGQIGWIGLIIPHISRMIVGSNNRYVIPLSISLGSSFMVIIETIARSISNIELPLSVLTALIGAPAFILLLRKNGSKFV